MINLGGMINEKVHLRSGLEIFVCATINNVYTEAAKAKEAGADGVGLFRSEMSFIGRSDLPSEDELYQEYCMLSSVFPTQPINTRVLDLGSDKIASFQEDSFLGDNPCMGNRSTRLLIAKPNLFRTQLRAMLRAATKQTTILLPLISGWHELDKIRVLIISIKDELRQDGLTHVDAVKFGIMVEVPSIVARFEDYVNDFDVFNIGSNDLTQYTLAADRNNQEVAEYYRFTHPSLLSMIQKVCDLGNAKGKPVNLCGEMASIPELLPLLIGLGIRRFSVPYRHIPSLKAHIRELDEEECKKIAHHTLNCRSSDEVDRIIAMQ